MMTGETGGMTGDKRPHLPGRLQLISDLGAESICQSGYNIEHGTKVYTARIATAQSRPEPRWLWRQSSPAYHYPGAVIS